MPEEKKVAPKATKKAAPKTTKKREPAKPKVKLVSYAIKMVIPTGAYANIQPEIIVITDKVEDAHDFIAPHMNKLWKEYYLINDRRVEPPKPKPEPVATPAPATVVAPAPAPTPVAEPVANEPVAEASPVSSVAMTKATQAIHSCMSDDALNIIIDQVEKSTKLTNADKDLLLPMASAKFEELTNK